MATSIDWGTSIITILQADMTPLGGGLYEFDVAQFHLDLAALQAGELGVSFPAVFFHQTEVTVSGVVYARKLIILSPYTVTISPATAYQVSCTGANHNIQDVLNNTTGPTFLPNNSAGHTVIDSVAEDALTLHEFIALK